MTVVCDTPVETHQRGSVRSWWLTALGVGVAFGMMMLGSVALLESRNDAWQQAEQSAGNLLLALDRDIERNIKILELSLLGLTEALVEPGIEHASPGVRRHALFDRSLAAEDLGSLFVLDQNGDIIEDSTSDIPHTANLADRDYFKIHQTNPNAGLFISRIYRSRTNDGELRFAISRRIPDPDGRFVGVVSAGLRLNYFRRLFEKLELGHDGTITLLRSDSRILFRYPYKEENVDIDVKALAPTLAGLMSARSGQYVAKSPIDGVKRLYTFRHIGDLPLILAVSFSTEEIYAPWRRKAMVIGPVMILLCAAAMASSLLFRREMIRRTGTERALAQAAEKLSVLAATDGLTGLINRRVFDLEFDRAFRRAVRQGTPIAVLMLDADCFKKFNDTYGHPAGDDVLRAIATCLETHLRRPDDTKARYGGEEFVAVLPDTGLQAAHGVAERIRVAVEALGIEHTGNPAGYATISIGVASTLPMVGSLASDLLQVADQALYAAKRDGRNCVRSVAVANHDDAAASSFNHLLPQRQVDEQLGGTHRR